MVNRNEIKGTLGERERRLGTVGKPHSPAENFAPPIESPVFKKVISLPQRVLVTIGAVVQSNRRLLLPGVTIDRGQLDSSIFSVWVIWIMCIRWDKPQWVPLSV